MSQTKHILRWTKTVVKTSCITPVLNLTELGFDFFGEAEEMRCFLDVSLLPESVSDIVNTNSCFNLCYLLMKKTLIWLCLTALVKVEKGKKKTNPRPKNILMMVLRQEFTRKCILNDV